MCTIIFDLCAYLLDGSVLQGADVSVGRGAVIDWRTVRSGEEVGWDLDTFDSATLFVSLVGEAVAKAALEKVRMV